MSILPYPGEMCLIVERWRQRLISILFLSFSYYLLSLCYVLSAILEMALILQLSYLHLSSSIYLHLFIYLYLHLKLIKEKIYDTNLNHLLYK